jgi:hypothetical protein
LAPILGALWIYFNQGTGVAGPVETVSHDQIEILAEKGDPEAELQMGLLNTSFVRGVKNDRIAVQWFEKAARHN